MDVRRYMLYKGMQNSFHYFKPIFRLSHKESMASAIIPNMKMICIFFLKRIRKKELFEGLGSTVSAWKNSVKNRFSIYFTDKNLVLATYLDPRFKITFLEDYCNNIKSGRYS